MKSNNNEDILKNAHSLSDDDNDQQVTKKLKRFNAKDFRKQLNCDKRLDALRDFLRAVKNEPNHDYIIEYLENGGGCLELLNTLESDSSISPAIVFELVASLLLNINAKHTQYHSPAHEACRYMVNNYLTVINKMLGLSSTREERRACLRLLTSMVAFSPTLAKDILLNVKFHSANIELLTKHTGERESVRDGFIHFLCAFLVDGHYPTISLLLEKRGLLTSIISGLRYDKADTVCIVITAMKNHILEHPSMYKTAKMKVFNTSAVREIVNLYNWKGPEELVREKGRTEASFEVDVSAKFRVSECVHDFLMVLCTSHKNGVVFRDPLIGLGKKNQNGLLFTVLESLDRPWEHSYASQLVLGICKACPDLVRTMWSNLRPFLEPRPTASWSNAIKFARTLVQELTPECIETQAKSLSVFQLSQVLEILVAPLPILKTVIVGSDSYEEIEVKEEVLLLLLDMLYSVERCIKSSGTWLSVEDHGKLKKYLSEYLTRNFPPAQSVITDSTNSGTVRYMAAAVDLLTACNKLAPHYHGSPEMSDTFFKSLLLAGVNDVDPQGAVRLQVKVADLLISFDSSQLLPKTDTFELVMPILLKHYHDHVDTCTFEVIRKILVNSGLFDGCHKEEILWINAILNIKHFDEGTARDITDVFKACHKKFLEYQRELSNVSTEKNKVQTDVGPNYKSLIENTVREASPCETAFVLKYRGLSVVIKGFLDCSSERRSKNLRKYGEFALINLLHMQTLPAGNFSVIEKYSDSVPKHVFEYVKSWSEAEGKPIGGFKGGLVVFKDFSDMFLNRKLNKELLKDLNLNLYSHLALDLVQAATFYFSQSVLSGDSLPITSENWVFFTTWLAKEAKVEDSYLDTVLGNVVLLRNFSMHNLDKNEPSNVCSRRIIEVIRNLVHLECDIDRYLCLYRNKVVKDLLKIISKPHKYRSTDNLLELLKIFNLNYEQCVKILQNMSHFLTSNQTDHVPVMYDVLNYCLLQVSTFCARDSIFKALSPKLIENIGAYLMNLSKKNVNVGLLSTLLRKYLEIFPHSIEYLDENLPSIIEYSKETVDLCCFLLERRNTSLNEFKTSIERVIGNKAVLVPLIDAFLVEDVGSDNDLKDIWGQIQPFILKMLQKPQKASHYFQENKHISRLIEKYMESEVCLGFFQSVQKFEVSEVFHVNLLRSVAAKVISASPKEKIISNVILTFIHIQLNLFKRGNHDDKKISEIAMVFNQIVQLLREDEANKQCTNLLASHETVKLYIKFCLKFGVSGQAILLEILENLVRFLGTSVELEQAKLILEMLISHSAFLDVIMGDAGDVKYGSISLFFILCDNYKELMERSHIPLLLSAYGAKVNRCDGVILKLLKMYEAHAGQTHFYDFRPMLWGRAAATHYSVRVRVENAILQQPKMSDVLNILQEFSVGNTVKNFSSCRVSGKDDLPDMYDLSFLLPLFSHLLAPEQQVKTYLFTKSGALGLTVMGMASRDRQTRQAACHVLARLHFHLEARQSGKDNLLWIRYVEALCRGAAVLPDFRLNNFAAIFFARMASILTQPRHVMYYSLSRYLTAKEDLDFSTVPELYTLLHSSDVGHKDHRLFILKLVRDGLKSDEDFTHLQKSMAHKLFSELYSSPVSDSETQLLILDVWIAICGLPLGCKMLCEHNSLVPQISFVLLETLGLENSRNASQVIAKVVEIYCNVLNFKTDKYSNTTIYQNTRSIVNSVQFEGLRDQCQKRCFQIFYMVYNNYKDVVRKCDLNELLGKSGERRCISVVKYGCKYLKESDFASLDDKYHFLRLLFFKVYQTG